MNEPLLNHDLCRKKLQGFLDLVANGQTPLYEAVCRAMLNDQAVLEIMSNSPVAQPGPNLFLAAVHYLLLRGADHELREFYGTCTPNPRPPADAWPRFRDFCLSHCGEIVPLLQTRNVQTNEVRRCSYWFPALAMLHRLPRGLAVIEIGASAGLNLNWNRYAYDYGPHGRFGNPNSPVVIQAEWRGRGPTIPPWMSPPMLYRRGIDLHPVDVFSSAEALWLQSLLWPDQPDRFRLQSAAIAEFRNYPVPLVTGNALQVLPAEIAAAPRAAELCLVHTHTLNQFSPADRTALTEIIREASRDRPIHVLSAEWIGTPQTELRLASWQNGNCESRLLANVDHHGRWLEWAF